MCVGRIGASLSKPHINGKPMRAYVWYVCHPRAASWYNVSTTGPHAMFHAQTSACSNNCDSALYSNYYYSEHLCNIPLVVQKYVVTIPESFKTCSSYSHIHIRNEFDWRSTYWYCNIRWICRKREISKIPGVEDMRTREGPSSVRVRRTTEGAVNMVRELNRAYAIFFAHTASAGSPHSMPCMALFTSDTLKCRGFLAQLGA